MCKYLNGPQKIEGCIGYKEDNCGVFNCLIRSPYLHEEDCQRMNSVLASNKLKVSNVCAQCSTTPCPTAMTCPPFPTCPTCKPVTCNCPTCKPTK